MDPVSEVTLAWLEQRAAGQARARRSFSVDESAQVAITRVVRVGVEDAVRDVVTPGLQESALATLLEGTAGETAQVTGRASLPRTLVAHLSSRFQALGDLGLQLESRQIAEVLTRHIGIRLAGAAGGQVLPPTAMALLARPPGSGVSVNIDELLEYLNEEEGKQSDPDSAADDQQDQDG